MKSPPSIGYDENGKLGIKEWTWDALRGIHPLEFFQNSNERSSNDPI